MKEILKPFLKDTFAGYVLSIYNWETNETKTIFDGYAEMKPNLRKMDLEIKFDIASLTKSFTAVLIFKAYEENKLQLKQSIYSIDQRFTRMKDVTVLDLLSHRTLIWTEGWLVKAKIREEFLQILFTAHTLGPERKYIDTNYIILANLLEIIYNKPFKSLLEEFFAENEMFDSSYGCSTKETASNNFDEGNGFLIEDREVGEIHDPKANHSFKFGIAAGHAGVFSTAKDMMRFLDNLFVKQVILKSETIKILLQHDNIEILNKELMRNYAKEHKIEIPKMEINELFEFIIKQQEESTELIDLLYHNYNYFGVRYYNPIKAIKDTPNVNSKNILYFSGYTGPAYFIDFENKNIIVLMCNICHMSKLSRTNRYKKVVEAFELINQKWMI